MKVTFLGVGEACDPSYPNTTIIVEGTGEDSCQIMLDCGFTTPHLYFKENLSPDRLEVLWVSHFHGDHFFGVPLMLLRFWEMQRIKPLTITGQKGIQKKISQAMELAYPGFMEKIRYPLDFIEIEPGMKKTLTGFEWQTAENKHSLRSLSLSLVKDGKCIFYSGDGRPTRATEELAGDCDLVIHEAFSVNEDIHGHGNINKAMEFAQKTRAQRLALVHLSQFDRKARAKEIKNMMQRSGILKVFLPEPGFVIIL